MSPTSAIYLKGGYSVEKAPFNDDMDRGPVLYPFLLYGDERRLYLHPRRKDGATADIRVLGLDRVSSAAYSREKFAVTYVSRINEHTWWVYLTSQSEGVEVISDIEGYHCTVCGRDRCVHISLVRGNEGTWKAR